MAASTNSPTKGLKSRPHTAPLGFAPRLSLQECIRYLEAGRKAVPAKVAARVTRRGSSLTVKFDKRVDQQLRNLLMEQVRILAENHLRDALAGR